MNLGDLRYILENYTELGDETPVVICIQPNRPLRLAMAGVISTVETKAIDLDLLADGDESIEGIDEESLLAFKELNAGYHYEFARNLLEKRGEPVEIRLIASDAHPAQGSPYGNGRDWDDCHRS